MCLYKIILFILYNIMKSNSQAGQDVFIRNVLKNKNNGYFLEIGSNDPEIINNTYLLEKELGWSGLMIEYNNMYADLYKEKRNKSIYVINDATKIDYNQIFVNNNFPVNMDYLQIDLEVDNRSTLSTLELLDNTIMNEYRFAVVTFEHDSYRGNYYNTRDMSRDIFKRRGYYLVFNDVKHNGCTFEDWYVHPDLVDMDYINKIESSMSLEYLEIMKRL